MTKAKKPNSPKVNRLEKQLNLLLQQRQYEIR